MILTLKRTNEVCQINKERATQVAGLNPAHIQGGGSDSESEQSDSSAGFTARIKRLRNGVLRGAQPGPGLDSTP